MAARTYCLVYCEWLVRQIQFDLISESALHVLDAERHFSSVLGCAEYG